ncbi:hypothetical protein QE152_g22089 [Popillia japonica]|uniref:Uncharacterized protein n=1 Tax=Popillia japonica TaxID=7064 RepID=A0AAW1KLN5_POPJA
MDNKRFLSVKDIESLFDDEEFFRDLESADSVDIAVLPPAPDILSDCDDGDDDGTGPIERAKTDLNVYDSRASRTVRCGIRGDTTTGGWTPKKRRQLNAPAPGTTERIFGIRLLQRCVSGIRITHICVRCRRFETRDLLRSQSPNIITDFLQHEHPPSPVNVLLRGYYNQTKKFLEDLKSTLPEGDSLLFMPADKGQLTVALTKSPYNAKSFCLLNDAAIYHRLNKDPTFHPI